MFRLHEWYRLGYVCHWVTVLFLQFIMSFVMYHEVMWKAHHIKEDTNSENKTLQSLVRMY